MKAHSFREKNSGIGLIHKLNVYVKNNYSNIIFVLFLFSTADVALLVITDDALVATTHRLITTGIRTLYYFITK